MTIPVEQLQKLDSITIIELFELQIFAPIHYATGLPVPPPYRLS